MFDNPKRALQRLQEELLAEEEDLPEEEYDEEYDEDLDAEDIDELLSGEDDEEDDAQELFYRNHANGYGAGVRNYANRYGRGSPRRFEEDEDREDAPEEDAVLYRSDYRKARRKTKRKQLGLVILAALELAAIIAIVVWWLSWM